jgi:uncharacterized protein (DUF433 family)
MAKSAPFSMRLSPELEAMVTAEARRTRRSRGAVVAALAEEAMKMRMLPGIAFKGEDWDRRAYVLGTGLDVWQIIDSLQDFPSVETMAEESELSEAQIRVAVAYRDRFPDEVDAAVAENRKSINELLAEYPEIPVVYVDDD